MAWPYNFFLLQGYNKFSNVILKLSTEQFISYS